MQQKNILEALFGSRKFVAALFLTVLLFALVVLGQVEAEIFVDTMTWVWAAFIGGTAIEDAAQKLRK